LGLSQYQRSNRSDRLHAHAIGQASSALRFQIGSHHSRCSTQHTALSNVLTTTLSSICSAGVNPLTA
jgi:hypothetical protein